MSETITTALILTAGAWSVAVAARMALRAPQLAGRVNTLLDTITSALAAWMSQILGKEQRSFEQGYELGTADTKRNLARPATPTTTALGRPELEVPTNYEEPLPDLLIAWIEAHDGHKMPEWQRADIIARYS
jgi:hypothetical protein